MELKEITIYALELINDLLSHALDQDESNL